MSKPALFFLQVCWPWPLLMRSKLLTYIVAFTNRPILNTLVRQIRYLYATLSIVGLALLMTHARYMVRLYNQQDYSNKKREHHYTHNTVSIFLYRFIHGYRYIGQTKNSK